MIDPDLAKLIAKMARATMILEGAKLPCTCMVDKDPDYMGPCTCANLAARQVIQRAIEELKIK